MCDRVPGFSSDASDVCLFVLGGRDVPERGVQPDGVEPRDVLDDGKLELRSGSPHAVGD